MVDDNREIDRTLEGTNFDKYMLINLPMEKHDDSSQEHTEVGLHRACTAWREFKFSERLISTGVQKTVALRTVSTSWQLVDIFAQVQTKIILI